MTRLPIAAGPDTPEAAVGSGFPIGATASREGCGDG